MSTRASARKEEDVPSDSSSEEVSSDVMRKFRLDKNYVPCDRHRGRKRMLGRSCKACLAKGLDGDLLNWHYCGMFRPYRSNSVATIRIEERFGGLIELKDLPDPAVICRCGKRIRKNCYIAKVHMGKVVRIVAIGQHCLKHFQEKARIVGRKALRIVSRRDCGCVDCYVSSALLKRPCLSCLQIRPKN